MDNNIYDDQEAEKLRKKNAEEEAKKPKPEQDPLSQFMSGANKSLGNVFDTASKGIGGVFDTANKGLSDATSSAKSELGDFIKSAGKELDAAINPKKPEEKEEEPAPTQPGSDFSTSILTTEMQMKLRRMLEMNDANMFKGAAPEPIQHPFPPVLIVEEGATDKQWQERLVDNGALADYTGGRGCTADTDFGAMITMSPTEYAAIEVRDPTSNCLRYVKVAGGGMFPVLLTADGGDAGDATTVCSFTYTVLDFADGVTELATEVTPLTQSNYAYGLRIAAMYGIAYWDGDNLALFCHEELSVGACP